MSFIYEINVMECLKGTYDIGKYELKKHWVINQQVCEKKGLSIREIENRLKIRSPIKFILHPLFRCLYMKSKHGNTLME